MVGNIQVEEVMDLAHIHLLIMAVMVALAVIGVNIALLLKKKGVF